MTEVVNHSPTLTRGQVFSNAAMHILVTYEYAMQPRSLLPTLFCDYSDDYQFNLDEDRAEREIHSMIHSTHG